MGDEGHIVNESGFEILDFAPNIFALTLKSAPSGATVYAYPQPPSKRNPGLRFEAEAALHSWDFYPNISRLVAVETAAIETKPAAAG
ncbi:MAG: hypothetical protein WCA35_15485 [Kovacikia sp.]